MFGGEGAAGTFNETKTYEPVRDGWETMAPMRRARHGLGSAVVQGHIHASSGGPTPSGAFSDLNEVFTPPSETSPKTD